MQQIVLNFVFMRNTAAQKFQIHGRCTITCKNDLYLYAISRKNYDLNFAFMRNFVQNWFRIDTKMMRNFVQKNHLVQNHETVAQENQLLTTF